MEQKHLALLCRLGQDPARAVMAYYRDAYTHFRDHRKVFLHQMNRLLYRSNCARVLWCLQDKTIIVVPAGRSETRRLHLGSDGNLLTESIWESRKTDRITSWTLKEVLFRGS